MVRKSVQGIGWRGYSGSYTCFTALGSCAIETGILSSPCCAALLPDPYQPLHFSCSSTDLPLVIMPEP